MVPSIRESKAVIGSAARPARATRGHRRSIQTIRHELAIGGAIAPKPIQQIIALPMNPRPVVDHFAAADVDGYPEIPSLRY